MEDKKGVLMNYGKPFTGDEVIKILAGEKTIFKSCPLKQPPLTLKLAEKGTK